MEPVNYDLTPEQIREIDQELQEKTGIEIDHEPFLTEQFQGLMMEETEA
ncbi:MAG: hypothetical protein ABEJ87_03520 [Candidatus Nanohalobium sp.]